MPKAITIPSIQHGTVEARRRAWEDTQRSSPINRQQAPDGQSGKGTSPSQVAAGSSQAAIQGVGDEWKVVQGETNIVL